MSRNEIQKLQLEKGHIFLVIFIPIRKRWDRCRIVCGVRNLEVEGEICVMASIFNKGKGGRHLLSE